MDSYRMPAGYGRAEYIEKKSRFIGQVFPVETEEEAKAHLEAVRKEFYDLRHHCWCYILKNGQKRYSDDGEPQGTAGQPMLNVFERESVENVLCVVSRYFGGILLGTGGLARAYGKAAKDALDAAGVQEMRSWTVGSVPCPYSLFERAKLLVTAHGGILDDVAYGAEIALRVLLPAEETPLFAAELQELSAGKVKLAEEDTVFRGIQIK